MVNKFTSLSFFISLEIDSLYGYKTHKNLHLHHKMSGWFRFFRKYISIWQVYKHQISNYTQIMANRVSVALFGFGRAGKIHFKNLCNNVRVDLRYIVEEYPSEAEKFVADYHLANTTVVHSDDFKTVLSDGSLQACVIATPTKTHESLVLASLDAGKAVFCEKPLANNVEAIGEECV